jgi:hypothetical protein
MLLSPKIRPDYLLLRVDGVVDTGVEFSGPIYFLSWARLSDLLVLKID